MSIDENRLPQTKLAATKASQPEFGIPKSRTFSILSGLTKSFSSGSITSRGNNSRNVSGQSSSESSTVTPAQEASHHPVAQAHRKISSQHDKSSPLSPSPGSPAVPCLLDNPKEVTTAMPPQYWAGRFMALHDRFHNELLEPRHLTQICEAQVAQFISPPNYSRSQAAQASAAAKNNPSTSIYANTRVAQTRKHTPTSSSLNRSRIHSRIPQSATSGAILQTTDPYPPPPYSQATLSSSSRHISSSKQILPPTTSSIRIVSTNTRNLHLPTSATTAYSGGNGNALAFIPENEHDHDRGIATITTTSSSRNPAPSQVVKSKKSSTYLADSEESRARRVLLHLEHMCATPEARASLHSWRTAYARKTGRAEFLPSGVSLTTSTTSSASDDVDSNKERTNEQQHGGHEFGEKGKRLVRRLRRSLLFSGSQDRGNKAHDEGGLLGRDGMGFVHAREKEKFWADMSMSKSKSECYGKDGSVKGNSADLKRVLDEEAEKLKRRGRHFSFF
ncbi:uncharacterized protein B0T15DRAFT_539454 [Chaetomium strumarium]|uniref:Uncharacterized protein n=1 Tax=Chaetomium strumarium TaxID=1170767 RepID=A0AAJ0GNC7_9PEZI|nr:hypothetical protein B0T15DRAFT_539454 [Chaetomium strumarium]